MNLGIIIIFEEDDVITTDARIFKSFFNQNVKICLVNNGNHKKIFRLLDKLKDSSKCDISILNLRKKQITKAAVKVGVRFLSSMNNVNLIIHTKPKNICNPKIIDIMLEVFEGDLMKKKDERVLLRSVYSIHEVLHFKLK
jgi:hypothetical protein